jgi:hypothetical protein
MQSIETPPRCDPKYTMTATRNKLKRLAARWPMAMIVLGFLLTVAWIGALIGIVLYFLMGLRF